MHFDEALRVFQKIPSTDYNSLGDSLNALTISGQVDYLTIIEHLEWKV